MKHNALHVAESIWILCNTKRSHAFLTIHKFSFQCRICEGYCQYNLLQSLILSDRNSKKPHHFHRSNNPTVNLKRSSIQRGDLDSRETTTWSHHSSHLSKFLFPMASRSTLNSTDGLQRTQCVIPVLCASTVTIVITRHSQSIHRLIDSSILFLW